jgi:hypothetical protein
MHYIFQQCTSRWNNNWPNVNFKFTKRDYHLNQVNLQYWILSSSFSRFQKYKSCFSLENSHKFMSYNIWNYSKHKSGWKMEISTFPAGINHLIFKIKTFLAKINWVPFHHFFCMTIFINRMASNFEVRNLKNSNFFTSNLLIDA